MNYINNDDFLNLLKDYQDQNDDTGEWLDVYINKMKKRFENGKIDQTKYDRCLEFYEYKKAYIKNKLAEHSKLSQEQNKERLYKVDFYKQKIGRAFLAIANGRIKTPQFIRYPLADRENMISDALFVMLRYADRFDCRKNNPFSYFTQAAFNSFIAYLNDKKKYESQYVSIDYIENLDRVNHDYNGFE